MCLQDLYTLAQDLAQHPTRMAEIVPTHPLYASCCDAALAGMGGVWLPSTGPYYPQHPPYIWWTPFPPQVQQELVTTTNPSGTITNLDLELVGPSPMRALWPTTGTYGNAQWPPSLITPQPSPGGPRPPSLPQAPLPTCSTPLAYTSSAIVTFYNAPTSQGPPTC